MAGKRAPAAQGPGVEGSVWAQGQQMLCCLLPVLTRLETSTPTQKAVRRGTRPEVTEEPLVGGNGVPRNKQGQALSPSATRTPEGDIKKGGSLVTSMLSFHLNSLSGAAPSRSQ